MEDLPKSYNPIYIRRKNLAYYNENIKNNPEKYAEKKKQISAYMSNRYKTDEEYREKQKLRQKQNYEKQKAKM
jgi:hypothetical protein